MATQVQSDMKNAANTVKSGFKDAKDSIKSKAQDLKDDVQNKMEGSNLGDTVDNITGTLKRSFGDLTSQIEDQVGDVREMTQKYVDVLTDYYKAHPFRILVSAVGVGIVLGRLMTAKPAIAKK